MSRCKSPVTSIRHERGSSADTGLIRIENLSSNGGSTDDPNATEDERVGEFFNKLSYLRKKLDFSIVLEQIHCVEGSLYVLEL